MSAIHVTAPRSSVAVITIDNPPQRNAITEGMGAELLSAFRDAEADPDVRVVVLTATGDRVFSSGHDLKKLGSDYSTLYDERINEVITEPARMSKPVIAAVNGAAYAGGFVLALNSDIRIGTPSTVFVASAARLGISPIGGQLSLLPRLLPPGVVKDMLLAAEPLTAERAYALGFLSEIVAQESLLDTALERAERIAASGPLPIRAIKEVIGASLTGPHAEADRLEWQRGAEVGASEDIRRGVEAFLTKQTPIFEGR